MKKVSQLSQFFLTLLTALVISISATAAVFYFGNFDLEHYANTAKIVTSFASVMVLSVSATTAIYIYLWQRKSARIEATKKLNDDLREYNMLVIKTLELQELEASSHPWGDRKLEISEVKKMYYYFILLNVSYNLYAAYSIDSIDKGVYRAQLDNTANNTCADRNFIEQHVFPRGYKEEFCKELIGRWDFIETTKKFISKNNKFTQTFRWG